nr:MAG TPA: hypothetical protein [Caudoviricetes sp.]
MPHDPDSPNSFGYIHGSDCRWCYSWHCGYATASHQQRKD